MASLTPRRHQSEEEVEEEETGAAVLVVFIAACTSSIYWSNNFHRTIQHGSKITGAGWMRELLYGHPDRIKASLGISQSGFRSVETLLREKSTLEPPRHISTTEQLGIFLYAVTTDLSMRRLAERFQRSTQTIHNVYHKVMRASWSRISTTRSSSLRARYSQSTLLRTRASFLGSRIMSAP